MTCLNHHLLSKIVAAGHRPALLGSHRHKTSRIRAVQSPAIATAGLSNPFELWVLIQQNGACCAGGCATVDRCSAPRYYDTGNKGQQVLGSFAQ